MDPDTKAFFERSMPDMPSGWSDDTVASELAQWAVEALADLPTLVWDEPDAQKRFDEAVEEAYTFYRGEALRFLEERNGRTA